MQSQLEKTKADYEKRVEAIKQEAEDLRTEIASLQAAKAELEAAQAKAEGSIQQARDEAAQVVRESQVGQLLPNLKIDGMTQMLDSLLPSETILICYVLGLHGTAQIVGSLRT